MGSRSDKRDISPGRKNGTSKWLADSVSSFDPKSSNDSPLRKRIRSSSNEEGTEFQNLKKITSRLAQLHTPSEKEILVDIFFFHSLDLEGNSDHHLSTWRREDARGELWPRTWLSTEFSEARIIAVSYDASIETTEDRGRMDLKLIAESLLEDICLARNQCHRKSPVILVGHGFGGLVIEKLCVEADRKRNVKAEFRAFLESIGGIFFYATPHRGMQDACFKPGRMATKGRANEPLLSFVRSLNEHAARLSQDFENIWKWHAWEIFGVGESRIMKGETTLLVEEGSSRFGKNYMMVEYDHLSICRPTSRTCSAYLQLVKLIRTVYEARNQKRKDEEAKLQVLRNKMVGAESLLREALWHLQGHAFLGFSGMGGVGKTAIAKLVYQMLLVAGTFDYTCFVDCSKLTRGDIQEVKEKICADNTKGPGTGSSSSEKTCEMDTRKKLLLVFDDITEKKHAMFLKKLSQENKSTESRFIATSRNKYFLRLCSTEIQIADVPTLKYDRLAWQLFLAHAFGNSKERKVPGYLEDHVKKVVQECARLPLALEFVGECLLEQEDRGVWGDYAKALRKAGSLLETGLWDKLWSSYAALGNEEQKLFLDLPCFLLREGCPFSFEDIRSAWYSMSNYASIGWSEMLNISLVQLEETVVETSASSDHARLAVDSGQGIFFPAEDPNEVKIKKVHVHQHLQALGRRTGKGRRVDCFLSGGVPVQDDSYRMAKLVALRESGKSKSGGLDEDGEYNSCSSECELKKNFSDLKASRYMELEIPHPLSCHRCETTGVRLPNGLRALHWKGSKLSVKLQSLGSFWHTLAVLKLERDDVCCDDMLSPEMCVQLSKLRRLYVESRDSSFPHTFGDKLRKLRHLEIHCRNLKELPAGFEWLSRLDFLRLKDCFSLKSLPAALGSLSSLQSLTLESCTRLETLPESFWKLSRLSRLNLDSCTELKTLPARFEYLSCLERLSLVHCESLESLSESFGNLPSLQSLRIAHCDELETLPGNFGNLSRLERLSLDGCTKLHIVPANFGNLSSLINLSLIDCGDLETLPDMFKNLSRLGSLSLDRCTKLQTLPYSIRDLSGLKSLSLIHCTGLTTLPDIFNNLSLLQSLTLDWCTNLRTLPKSIKDLSDRESFSLSLVGVEDLS